jgi:hypothetical protein
MYFRYTINFGQWWIASRHPTALDTDVFIANYAEDNDNFKHLCVPLPLASKTFLPKSALYIVH